jgi:hypothetical protein
MAGVSRSDDKFQELPDSDEEPVIVYVVALHGDNLEYGYFLDSVHRTLGTAAATLTRRGYTRTYSIIGDEWMNPSKQHGNRFAEITAFTVKENI